MNIMWTADIPMKWRCDHRSWWSHLLFIRMSAVHIIFIYFIPFTGMMNSINWPAPNVWVFTAQLVEHCSANAEAMGSNPIEAPKTFFGLTLRLLKSQWQLRWSHLHFHKWSVYPKWKLLSSYWQKWSAIFMRNFCDMSANVKNGLCLTNSERIK